MTCRTTFAIARAAERFVSVGTCRTIFRVAAAAVVSARAIRAIREMTRRTTFAVARAAERLVSVGTCRTIFRVAAATVVSARTTLIVARGAAFAIFRTSCRAARTLVDRMVVFRKVGIVRSTPGGMFARGVIGITPGTGATFDTFGRGRPLPLVACETVENLRRVAVVVFHFDSN